MLITVVGDKQLVKPGLERLGYELVELDKDGNPVPPAGATVGEKPAGSAAQGRPAPASPPAEKKKKGRK